ncbi:MAG TPA: GAF domain-containing protein [Streptosporangiaceae bacterium]|nr:GAF domain-containing protein [Streptosporangiaceae bacterium]
MHTDRVHADNPPREDRHGQGAPRLRPDDLLAGLQARLEGVRATRDRVQALLDVVVSIGSDMDLDDILRRITQAATTLTDARYGALGVVDEKGERLVELITVGFSENEITAIGPWPEGHGILSRLIRERRPLQLSDLTLGPGAAGIPGNDPGPRRFLGLPIQVRDEIFGNLYLAEKADGTPFDGEDEVVVAALATAAGVAIENARLLEERWRRERWLEASAEISTALLSGTAPAEVLELVAQRAREICNADHAMVYLVDDDAEEFILTAADGPYAGDIRGLRVPVEEAIAGHVYRGGASVLVPDSRHSTTRAGLPEHMPVGATLIVPLGVGDEARGVLTVANPPGGRAFTQPIQWVLESFASQAAVMLELAEHRRDAERLVVLEDRDRIAKDLHDTVIQRLFAIAITLMSALKIIKRPEASVRVQRAVDDLDDTIRRIRSSIFALQSPSGEGGLRSGIHAIIDAAAENLGFAPSVRLEGLLDIAVADDVAEHALAVLQEALSNVARHARAHRANVSVDVGDDLVLRVTDDGIGIAADIAAGIADGGYVERGGLRNMCDRARGLGGHFEITLPGDGTVLTWRVPVKQSPR